jgi:hypothetical protein
MNTCVAAIGPVSPSQIDGSIPRGNDESEHSSVSNVKSSLVDKPEKLCGFERREVWQSRELTLGNVC